MIDLSCIRPDWARIGDFSVAEPASIALLGSGLISFGVDSKKKPGKKAVSLPRDITGLG